MLPQFVILHSNNLVARADLVNLLSEVDQPMYDHSSNNDDDYPDINAAENSSNMGPGYAWGSMNGG